MTHKRLTKRMLVIGIMSLLIVVGAGVYTWLSLSAWKAYETRLVAEQLEYRDLRATALGKSSMSEKLAAIRALDDKLAARGELCDMNSAFAWQAHVIPPLRQGVEQCERKVGQLGVVAGPLHELRTYLDTADGIRRTLAALAPDGALTDKNWSEQGVNRARAVQSELGKRNKVTGKAAVLQSKAIGYADALVKSWQELVDANQAKDKVKFLVASAAVTKAYADFAGLADITDADIVAQVAAVQKAANDL